VRLFPQFISNHSSIFVASAILSDVTTPANRAKALAHVGIAFAICFCIGPPIGAYFASRPLPASINTFGLDLNVYAVPAAITLVLLVLETLFLILALPETRGKRMVQPIEKPANGASPSKPAKKASVEQRIRILKSLRLLHFLFLGVFSGVEFTLTFLTFDCTFQ
jgi:MFS family permease